MRLNPFRRRNPFKLKREYYTSFNQGDLIPVFFQEVYPGDSFDITAYSMVRYAPMIAPKFGGDSMTLHFFFVPCRLAMEKFPEFITNGPKNNSNIEWPHLVAPEGGWTKYSLPDYFGWQLGVAGLEASAFKARVYNLVYNEWYRQEYLQDPVAVSLDAGTDSTTSLSIQKRNWHNDYFTRALPFRQLGLPSTLVLADDSVPVSVSGNGKSLGITDGTHNLGFRTTQNVSLSDVAFNVDVGTSAAGSAQSGSVAVGVTTDSAKSGLVGSADLSSVQAFSVNTLRAGVQIQKWMERAARGGNRMVENILAHFGIRSSDARLQRPEFLGAGRAYTAFSEVLQTSSSNATSPQGNMAGHGVNANKTARIRKSFEEWGWIIGIASVMTDTLYCQGIPREDSRKTYLDYMWPEFAHLGEQGIKNKEIYAQGPSVVDDDGNVVDEQTWGYTPMYEELRHGFSHITADMRDDLAFWSQARIFSELPTLSGDFLKANHSNRVFAVEDDSVKHLWAQFVYDVRGVRPLPRRGEPGFIDH